MKKKPAALLALAMAASLLTGCAGKPAAVTPVTTETTEATEATAAPVKTGLYIGADLRESQSADGEGGKAKFEVTMVAVTVSDDGVIESCVIDSLPATVEFDAEGVITTDLTAEVLTKNELGEDYGMKAYGGAQYEWNEQAAALARYAEGKTVEQLKTGAVDETGYAKDADLASIATIYLGSYVDGIEAAVNNARHLGAQSGDRLTLASLNALSGTDAADEDGTAQMDCQITAVTMNGDVISSCYIDSIQPKVTFDAKGEITSDLTAEVLTKNELGESYGMKAYGGAQCEWNEQAASFAAYVTGKTAAEVEGIAVTEAGKAEDADLASTVTISIGSFLDLIAKAAS